MSHTDRKQFAKRAFAGLVVRPSDIDDLKRSPILRQPKSHAQSTPVETPILDENENPFYVNGKLATCMDADCSFQEFQFDPGLSRGKGRSGRDMRSYSFAISEDKSCGSQLFQDLCVSSDAPTDKNKPLGLSIGFLPGSRVIRHRRITRETWWLLEESCMQAFVDRIRNKPVTPKHSRETRELEAKQAEHVLYKFYVLGLEDKEICTASPDKPSIPLTEAKVRSLRQYLKREGLGMFGSRVIESRGWEGRHKTWADFRQKRDEAHLARLQENADLAAERLRVESLEQTEVTEDNAVLAN